MENKVRIAHKRLEVLLKKVYPTLINYPKIEHESICKEIKLNYYKALSNLSDYLFTEDTTSVKIAEGKILNLKVLNEISKERRFISEGFFNEVSKELTVISRTL